MTPAAWLAVSAYVGLMAWVAVKTRRLRDFGDFAIAERRLPALLLFASISATYIGPGFSIGAAEQGKISGWWNLLLFLPYAIQTLLVGWVLAPRLSEFKDCVSVGEVVRRKSNRAGHILAGLSSVLICIMITAFLAKVAGETLQAAFGFPFLIGVLAVTGVGVAYTALGGLQASVATDAIQFGVFTSLIGGLAIVGFLATDNYAVAATAVSNTTSSMASMPFWTAAGTALSFLLGETLIPPYTTRALASGTKSISRRAFVYAGLFCVVWLVSITSIGVSSAVLIPDSTDTPLLAMAQQLFPHWLAVVMPVAIVGILMSSQDSVLNSGAVSFTQDIVEPLFPIGSDERRMRIGRAATVGIAGVGAVSAGWLPGIIDALVLIYSIWAPTVLIPLVAGLFFDDPHPWAAPVSIVVGGSVSIGWQVAGGFGTDVPAILPGLTLGVLAWALTARRRKERVV